MIDVDALKKKIITFLEEHGPSIPVKIAKNIEQEPVFTSALLGELTSVKKVYASNMRVGASQIYFLPGQEQQLEGFADEHLGGVVKRAYLLLKEHKYVVDKEQEPAIRVALRSLKDFATAFMHNDEVMWRYNFVPKEEVAQLLNNRGTHKSETKVQEKRAEEETTVVQEIQEPVQESVQEETREIHETQKKLIQDTEQREKEVEEKQEGAKEEKSADVKPREKTQSVNAFSEEVKTFLESKGVALVEDIEESRNEFVGVVRVRSDLGEVEYLVIARNKKSINDSDLRAATSRAHEKHMPCYLLHKGKLTKAGSELLEDFKNVVKVEKIE